MLDEYDFDNSRPNTYVKRERKPVTMRIDVETIDYFKKQAEKTGIPYQNIINLYLTQCAQEGKELKFV